MMKLKKILTGKPFIVGILTVFCAGTLALSLYLNSDKRPDFIPEPTPAGQLTSDWEESKSIIPSGIPGGPIASGGEAAPQAGEDQYPKEVKNKDNHVVVDFTDPDLEKPQVPEKPATSADTQKPDKPPANTPGTPAPGSKNAKGEVYDPVFGWIKPGAAAAEPIHNDGDPNKQVGSMD